jgi:SAM-dependent methyltransferase
VSGLTFTEEAAKQLEKTYRSKDVVAQRSYIIRQLSLAQGERVLDIGCGPGFLCESIAEVVGHNGAVAGIDISPDLIALCNRRRSAAWLSYSVGDATQVEHADASFDVAVCMQVAEYVPDVDRIVAEAFRVLKPGGRTLFVATDWDGVVWHSKDPDRMKRVLKSWEAHCAHPRLPRSLPKRLKRAGFRLDGTDVFPILNLEWADNTYSKGMTTFIRDFVSRRNDVPLEDVEEWTNEFQILNEAGEYFFSSNRYIFKAAKPDP